MGLATRFSWEVPQPQISKRDFAGAFDLKSDDSLCRSHGRIVINEDGHEMSVHDVHQRSPSRNDVNLIPFTRLDVILQLVGIAQCREKTHFFALLGAHNLAASGDDAARRGLLVKLTGVTARAIEIGLIAFQVPL